MTRIRTSRPTMRTPSSGTVFAEGGVRGSGGQSGRPQRPAREDRQEEDETSTTDPDAGSGVGFWTVAGSALAALLAALLLVPLAKVLRRARRRRTSSWSGVYVNGWQEVLDTARDRGTPVPDAWSRVAQASSLGVGLDLARSADAAVFARQRRRRRTVRSSGTSAQSSDAASWRSRTSAVACGPTSTPPRSSPRGRVGAPTAQSRRPACATKIAVPGVSSPRARDHPPQTRSCCSGHSGSTRSTSTKPLELSRRTQSPSVRWCST